MQNIGTIRAGGGLIARCAAWDAYAAASAAFWISVTTCSGPR